MRQGADARKADALSLEVLDARDVATRDDMEPQDVFGGRKDDPLRRAGVGRHPHDRRTAAADIDVAVSGMDEFLRHYHARALPDQLGRPRRDELRNFQPVALVDAGVGGDDKRKLCERNVAELDTHRERLLRARCAHRRQECTERESSGKLMMMHDGLALKNCDENFTQRQPRRTAYGDTIGCRIATRPDTGLFPDRAPRPLGDFRRHVHCLQDRASAARFPPAAPISRLRRAASRMKSGSRSMVAKASRNASIRSARHIRRRQDRAPDIGSTRDRAQHLAIASLPASSLIVGVSGIFGFRAEPMM